MPTNSIATHRIDRRASSRSVRNALLFSVLGLCVALAANSWSPTTVGGALAQERAAIDQRSLQKVAVPSPASSVRGKNSSEKQDGITYIALSPGLESISRGREPNSLIELRALEAQQSKVADAIEQVTVNVQQGPAQGSGVIITPDGFVLTAAHVAGKSGRDAWVILSDGTRVKAETRGMNRDKDAGLLKIVEARATPWPHATLGRSSELNEGEWVVAAGHPGGWKAGRGSVIRVGRVLSISQGPISKGSSERAAHTLFTDCALIGGDSGGPLFSLEGKLVGIHSRIGTNVVDNMHVPIDVFATDWERMVRNETWGILPGYQPVIGVEGTKGDDRPLIASVKAGGSAHRAGILPGDLILTIDGTSISTFEELRKAVESSMPGDVLVLTLLRGEDVLRLPVSVGVSES